MVDKDLVVPFGQHRDGAGWISVGYFILRIVEVATVNNLDIVARPRTEISLS